MNISAWRAVEDAGVRVPGCPKRMVYGPCGGVRANDRCELDDRPCPFVALPVVRWQGGPPAGDGPDLFAVLEASPPVVLIDLHVLPFAADSVRAVTARLAGSCDGVLVGEHQSRPDFPPTVVADMVLAAGGRPWVTLTGRDRNRVVLEAELAGLAELGSMGVHCVTGDGRGQGVRPDATQVFDLDGTRLAALARAIGLCPSVAATPTAAPTALRPARLLEKQRAGARACIVNHSGGPEAVSRFVTACRAVGVTMPFIACVAVATDARSLQVLERFPGLVIDPRLRERILTASDARAAGVAAAVAEAQQMLAIDGVAGINLSGAASSASVLDSASIMADIASQVRASVDS